MIIQTICEVSCSSSITSVTFPSTIARSLAYRCWITSIDRDADTPFSRTASEEFNAVIRGGKMDDITVVCFNIQ